MIKICCYNAFFNDFPYIWKYDSSYNNKYNGDFQYEDKWK
jgi:hypothetical protein